MSSSPFGLARRPSKRVVVGVLGSLLFACATPRHEPAPGARVLTVGRGDAGVLVSAEPRGEESEAWVMPCAEGSAEHAEASAKLEAISTAIRDLPAAGDPKPLEARMIELGGSRCFEVGIEQAIGPFESALSLKTFWKEGGHEWMTAPLRWGKAKDRWAWIAPSVRKAITKESAGGSPLAELACPATPGACGAETNGWRLRAERALAAHAHLRRLEVVEHDPPGEPPTSHERCKRLAASAPAERAFVDFMTCLGRLATTQDALPLGAFQAPKDGWLVLRGRRGHHSWCNELRAYDLATGAAYIVASCGAMFGMPPPPPRAEKGRVPVEALREAAWMMMLAEASETSILVSGFGHHVPDAIAIRAPKERAMSIRLGSIGSSSGRTTLVYQWVRAGKSVVTGTVNWPDAHSGAHGHATELLAIAEAGMKSGCAPAALPVIPWAARRDERTRVSPHGYFPAYDEPDFARLEGELEKIGSSRPLCP